MKLTKEMKAYSGKWLESLVHLSEFGTVQPAVPYHWEQGMSFGTYEARIILNKVETTEEWKAEIMKAISRRKVAIMKSNMSDQKILNSACVMGLKAALSYAECIEFSGGMEIEK